MISSQNVVERIKSIIPGSSPGHKNLCKGEHCRSLDSKYESPVDCVWHSMSAVKGVSI